MRDISVERIKLQNFKCIEDFDLTLDNSLYLVSGRNGSGKTSLFESIYVCLYNRRPNGKPASNVIKKGKDFSEIELVLKVNDTLHTITRRIGKGSKFTIETEDGTKIKGNEAKKFIEEIIPQYVVRLSLLQDVDLKDIFTKIIDIEPLVESAHKKSSLVKQKINEYNTKLSQLESEQQRIQFSINDAQQRINQINQQLQQIANLSIDVDISEEQLFEILEKQKQFNKVYQQLKDELSQKVSLEVNQLWQEQSKISSELHVYQSKINELQNAFTAEIEDLLSPLYHEMISWYIQVDEARKIKNNEAVPTPFIDNLIKARDLGETREEFADLVISNYNYYIETYSKKLGKYQKLIKLVEKANTLTDIDKILW